MLAVSGRRAEHRTTRISGVLVLGLIDDGLAFTGEVITGTLQRRAHIVIPGTVCCGIELLKQVCLMSREFRFIEFVDANDVALTIEFRKAHPEVLRLCNDLAQPTLCRQPPTSVVAVPVGKILDLFVIGT